MKKAFTLIELLGVITIISILMIIVVPIVTKNLKSTKDSIYDSMINRILSSAVDYASLNSKVLPSEGENIDITLGMLQSLGLISTDLKNPKTNRLFPSDLVINISYVKSNRNNEKIKYAKYDGDFLFKVDINSGNKVENIKDDYTIIELNSSSLDVDKIVYKDKDNNDISLKEYSVQIIKDNMNVSSIDTKETGLYYVYYSKKNASFVRLFKVIDTQLPEIIFPNNDTISVNIDQFDLYNNVVCKDNSNSCDLKIIDGEDELYNAISKKKTGNYVVTYKAVDPSFNMITKKRVIELTN